MAKYSPHDLPSLYEKIGKDTLQPIYLLCGDRALCKDAADELIARLLPDEKTRRQNLILVDGENETLEQTLAQLKTFNLFQGRRVIRVKDSRLFFSKNVAENFWKKACAAKDQKDDHAALRYLLKMLESAGLKPEDWQEEQLGTASDTVWKNLLGFSRPSDKTDWADSLLALADSRETNHSHTPADAADLYIAALENGLPADNILIVLAEAVDKRKKLYKTIEKLGAVIDLTVDSGFSKKASEERESILRKLVRSTLEKYGKNIEARAIPILLERVGFHPDAVVMETEKLALYCADNDVISIEDLDALTGRTKEEALFEFTEAFVARNIDKSLKILNHMLEQNNHPLMILAGLHNHIRRVLAFAALQSDSQSAYIRGMGYPLFQKNCLPQMKDSLENLPFDISKNPYAQYMLFKKAEDHICPYLVICLKKILQAELLIKSTSLDARIILENLIFDLLLNQAA